MEHLVLYKRNSFLTNNYIMPLTTKILDINYYKPNFKKYKFEKFFRNDETLKIKFYRKKIHQFFYEIIDYENKDNEENKEKFINNNNNKEKIIKQKKYYFNFYTNIAHENINLYFIQKYNLKNIYECCLVKKDRHKRNN